jgi:hypothetical protein
VPAYRYGAADSVSAALLMMEIEDAR